MKSKIREILENVHLEGYDEGRGGGVDKRKLFKESTDQLLQLFEDELPEVQEWIDIACNYNCPMSKRVAYIVIDTMRKKIRGEE